MQWEHEPQASISTLFRVSPNFHECFYLTNKFHVAVRLFSNRSQMTSKCGKNKKVAQQEFVIGHKNHATVKLDANGFSWNENVRRKQN